jgi:hypothetical protein
MVTFISWGRGASAGVAQQCDGIRLGTAFLDRTTICAHQKVADAAKNGLLGTARGARNAGCAYHMKMVISLETYSGAMIVIDYARPDH